MSRPGRFAAWTAVGAVGAYALLYALSPLGIALLALAWAVANAIPRTGGRFPEVLGLLAGGGFLALLIARSADAPGAWLAAGIALIVCALAAYATAVARLR